MKNGDLKLYMVVIFVNLKELGVYNNFALSSAVFFWAELTMLEILLLKSK